VGDAVRDITRVVNDRMDSEALHKRFAIVVVDK
jgi:hypothetical protein